MRLLVCGGRDFRDTKHAYVTLDRLHRTHGIDVLIEGDARGADRIAGYWARRNRIDNLKFPADWKAHGLAAGTIRNGKMLAEGKPDLVLAFPGGRGTADMMRRARAAGVPIQHEICIASADTLPKGQDAQQGLAGTESGAVPEGQTPTPDHLHRGMMSDLVDRAVENCTRKLRFRTEDMEAMWASGDEERTDDFALAVNASDLRALLDRIEALESALRRGLDMVMDLAGEGDVIYDEYAELEATLNRSHGDDNG